MDKNNKVSFNKSAQSDAQAFHLRCGEGKHDTVFTYSCNHLLLCNLISFMDIFLFVLFFQYATAVQVVPK